MTEVAKTEEKATRTKKGEGPVVLNFLDSEKKEYPRISEGVTALQIKDKVSGVFAFDLSALPQNVIRMLAADALKRRVDTAIRAAVDTDGKNDKGEMAVIPTAQSVIDRILKGEIYAKTGVAGEGGGKGRGRPFDYDLWVEAMGDAAKMKAQKGLKRKDGTPFTEATPEQLAKLKAKMEAATPADRQKMTQGFLKDNVVAFAVKRLQAKRAQEAAQKELDSGDSVELD